MADVIFPDGTKLSDILANINTYTTEPATSTGEGELAYFHDTSKVYMNTGSAVTPVWSDISAGGSGMSDLVDDTTPQLGGDLDCNSKIIDGCSKIRNDGGSLTMESSTGVFIFKKT